MPNHLPQPECDVAIVGAGLAGLTAAWVLTKQGFSVRVFEAEAHPGGRIARGRLGDRFVDQGAQFWSTGYRVIPALVREMGLTEQIRSVTPQSAVLIDGHLHIVNSARPWSLVQSGLLSLADATALAASETAAAWRDRGRDASLTDPWVAYDAPLSALPLRPAVRQRLIDPMLNAFYFYDADTSGAVVRAMTALGRRGQLVCLAGGLGQLTERLAAKVKVQFATPVDAVEMRAEGVLLTAGAKTWKAKHAILGVPAPVAQRLYPGETEVERSLLATRYTAGATLTLLCAAHWTPPARLAKVYGIILPGTAVEPFAALTFERNKTGAAAGSQQVNVLLNATTCGMWLLRPDEEVTTGIVAALETYLPGLASAIEDRTLRRWPLAMPCTPPGRVSAVRDYWQAIPQDRRVWLAGDYMGFPWSDAAAASGERVAQAIASRTAG